MAIYTIVYLTFHYEQLKNTTPEIKMVKQEYSFKAKTREAYTIKSLSEVLQNILIDVCFTYEIEVCQRRILSKFSSIISPEQIVNSTRGVGQSENHAGG